MFPTDRRLADGDSVILDLAPVAHGVASDVAYSCAFGHNDVFAELDAGLARIRTTILEGIRAGESMLMLYHELDEQFAEHGWESCHHRYADRALGHLVFPLGARSRALFTTARVGHRRRRADARGRHRGPRSRHLLPAVERQHAFTDYPATPGLWAIEPHIGR